MSTPSTFPCSICKTGFNNPKDLGNHILKQHCLERGSSTPPESLKDDSEEEDVEEEEMETDEVEKSNHEWAESLNNHRFNNIVKDLPRDPTEEETRQRFMSHQLSDLTRYICLICSKAYTSRYNIRMHMNLHLGRNVHACKFCERTFAHKHVYESHLRTHTGEKPFRCGVCGRPFSDRSNCSAHQKKCRSFKTSPVVPQTSSPPPSNASNSEAEEETEPKIPLVILPREPLPLHEISDHIPEIKKEIDHFEDSSEMMSLPQIVSVGTCVDLEEIQIEPDIMDLSSDSEKKQGNAPIQKPIRNPPRIYTCSFCSAKFKEQEYLFKHLSEHINIPKSVDKDNFAKGYLVFYFTSRLKGLCLYCGKIFGTEEQVKIHINVHLEENIYNCRFCRRIFTDFSQFEVHFKSHDEEFKFNCRYCENAFMSRMALAQHVKTCTSSSLVQEDTRPKSPGDKSVHLAPSPSSEASYCGRSDDEDDPFSDEYTPDNNSNNVINTSAINPPPNEEERTSGFCLRQLPSGQTRFICVRCGKHYTTNYNMRQHINIHTGKGLHACRYCKRSFTHKHVCETHERIHTGERPFKCEHCAKNFADRSNYNSHRRLCALTLTKAA